MADSQRYDAQRRPDDYHSDLARFYTNTEHAFRILDMVINAPVLTKRLLIVYGLGGVGKSTLLKMYELYLHGRQIPTGLISSDELPSPADILGDWAEDLSRNSIKLSDFQKTLRRFRAIQKKVEEKAQSPQLATRAGKVVAQTVIGLATSAIPIVGPLINAVGSASTDAFVDWLGSFLKKSDLEFYIDPIKQLDADFLTDLAKAAARQRLVLMIDTYEKMTVLDNWMRELAHRLPKNVLLIIASRLIPEWDRAWPGWMGSAEIVPLQEMSPQDLILLIRRYYAHIHGAEPDPRQVEAIVQFARGLPMVATTVVQLWVKYHVEDFQTVRPQVVADLVDRLLEGVSQEMRPVFEAAAVLRYFDADSLKALLEDGNAEKLYEELRRWPFIRSRREGLSVHDTIREMMNEALYARSAVRFRTLHERAAAYYGTQGEKALGVARARFAAEQLYHLVRVDEINGMQLFRQWAEDLARYGLLDQLRALLNDVNTYPLHLENSRLWIRYYEARLKDIEGHPAEAEPLYQAIADSKEAEDILSAYALCDLAWSVSKTDVRQALQFLERVEGLYPEPEKLPTPDAKLAFYLLEISGMYRELGRWQDALAYLERAQKFFESINDLYWLASIHNQMKYYYLDRGMWKEASQKQKQGLQEIARFARERQSFLEAELLASVSVGWMWAGRYSDTEQQLRRAISLTEQFGREHQRMYILRDLGLALGLQGKLQEASQAFQAGLEIGRQQDPIFEAVTQAMQAIIALKWSGADVAERYFSMCMGVLRQQTGKRWALLQILGPYGRLQELKGLPEQAERIYRETLQIRELEQWYWYIGALTGLVRVYYRQGRYTDLTPLLQEAEPMAQQYEHYDHLASLSIIQGHLAWDNVDTDEGQRWDNALHHYQQAMIYALRYNRFFLDEVLSGLPHGSVLHPIIPHCLNHVSDGQQMLLALRNWWQEGFNDTGVSRPDSISTIPEGISLRDGEDLAFRKESGDGAPRKTVLVRLAESL